MTLPIVRQKYPSQIGMIIKHHAEQIVGLSLVPIRRPPNVTHGRHVYVILSQNDFQPNAMMSDR